MADADNKEVKQFTERHEVTPTEDDETVEGEENETPADSSEAGNEGEEGATTDGEPEGEPAEEEPAAPAPVKKVQKPAAPETQGSDQKIKRIEGETPREYALRLEVTRLKSLNRIERTNEILGEKKPVPQATKELSPEKKKVLEKYKPEDIQALKEVIDVMAEDMGFVRKEEMGATTYQEKANEELNGFLEKHPEYLPENDPGNVLWERFKEEFGLYKQPANPKDYKKIFDKVHSEVYGIKPTSQMTKVNAANEKIKVASHAGASRTAPIPARTRPQGTTGLRTDMLKGFTDEEIAELGE